MRVIANISSVDRLGLTLLFAAVIHGLIIMGVTFSIDPPKKAPPADRTLEIMVVQNPIQKEKPKKADFLSQVSQTGGGNVDERVKPKTARPTPPPQAQPKPPEPQAEQPVPSPAVQKSRKVLTQDKPIVKKILTRPRPKPAKPHKRRISAAQLLASTDREIKRLTASLDRKTEAFAKRPRRKVLTAATQEYKYANYLDAWRRKVERVGNLNYPDEAKRRKLYGNLILHVAVRSDGSIKAINVKKSSGHRLLDDAAIRIVKLSSPFPPFPVEIRKETEIVDIIRTWQFQSSNRLFAK